MTTMTSNRRETFYKVLVLTGSMLVMSPLCFSLFYGNLSTYMYSVFFSRSLTCHGDMDPAWMYSIHLVSNAFGTLTMDVARKKCGLRFVTILGISLYCASFFLTYFTVTLSVWATSLTFALLSGLGVGISEMALMYYVAGWFKDRVGLASALLFCAGSLGGMVINPVITACVNPYGYSTDSSDGPITYFSQTEVRDRVPMTFIVLGSVIAPLQCGGFLMLRKPPSSDEDHEVDTRHLDNEEHAETYNMENNSQSRNSSRQSAYTDVSGSPHPDERTDVLDIINLKKPKSTPDVPRRANNCETSERRRGGDGTSTSGTDSVTPPCDQERLSKTPIQVLKSEKFYVLTFSLIAQTLCLLIAVNYNKLFGQFLIADDEFLALTSSVASCLLVAFRLAGGHMIDWLGVKTTILVHIAGCSILLSLWYFTALLSRWVYLVWTGSLLSTANNVFLIYPLATLKLFGQSFFATNLGLIQTASVVINLVAPPLLTMTLYSLGWFWLFFSAAAMLSVVDIIIISRM